MESLMKYKDLINNPRQTTAIEKDYMQRQCRATQEADPHCDGPSDRFVGSENICMECQKQWLRDLGWREDELPTVFKSLWE